MGGHDVGLEVLREVEDALGFFHCPDVCLSVCKAVAEIAAQSGDDKAVGLDEIEKFAALFRGQLLRRHRSVGGVDLESVCADLDRLEHSGADVGLEGIEYNADLKKSHIKTSE